jgi:hypothetical protein
MRSVLNSLTDPVEFQMESGSGVLTFSHRVMADELHYFAFCYPKSYDEVQSQLCALDLALGNQACRGDLAVPKVPSSVYYAREIATLTLDGRRMDLVTVRGLCRFTVAFFQCYPASPSQITSYKGMLAEREEGIEGLFPEEVLGHQLRPHKSGPPCLCRLCRSVPIS